LASRAFHRRRRKGKQIRKAPRDAEIAVSPPFANQSVSKKVLYS
jgi:hypothetical protein